MREALLDVFCVEVFLFLRSLHIDHFDVLVSAIVMAALAVLGQV